ncbi:MAG: DUF6992 family protein [Anaerolineae bacterium]
MGKPKVDIWQFQMELSARLMRWAGFSIGAGTALALTGDRFKQGVGEQFIGWGVINGLLAFFGARNAPKQSAEPEAHTPARQAGERRNLRTILSVNTGLDVLYVLGGLWLARTKGEDDDFWRGAGQGIVVQGAFLFVFDLIHALNLKRDA